jgi:predicted dehydrogenase
MGRLRVGVVGVGHLGRHHARILAGLEEVELVGVADSRIEQARAVAEPLRVDACVDYRDLLGRVDAISVAVPTSLHREIGSAFLRAGIPTLVEEPLAASLAEATAMVDLARSTGTMLQVGHIERFNPALRAVADAGLRPRFVAAERLGLYTFRSTDIGVVHDLMIHDIDLLLSWVAAPVRRVSAVGVSIFGRLEDVANAWIEFEDGCVANLTASRASYQAVRKMRLWGEQGYAALDFASRQATIVRPSARLRAGDLGLDGLDLGHPGAIREHLFGNALEVEQVPPPESREPLAEELEDFVRAVRGGSRPKVTGDDALRAMRLADQVLRSLEAHQWEGRPEGPVGPRRAIAQAGRPNSGLPRPKSWGHRIARRRSTLPET